MSSTAYAKRTAYKPIDFFFRSVVDLKTKEVLHVDAFQILNDRYMGRMSVCNYFFIAENSVRINELNIIALDELKAYNQVMRENFFIPENQRYSLPLTTRFLESDKDFDILRATLTENGYKKTEIVLTFDCAALIALDDIAVSRYARLRKLGYKTCVNGFGEEFNSLDIFAKFKFDYLRVEAAYFDGAIGKKKLLEMLVKFTSANKIKLIVEGVDSASQKARFKKSGVRYVTGKAVSKLSRYVTREFLGLPAQSDAEKELYIKNLQKLLQSIDKKESEELEALRIIAENKSKNDVLHGKVSQSAHRPELVKSPYQLRLEHQKQAIKAAAAKKLAKEQLAIRAALAAKAKLDEAERLQAIAQDAVGHYNECGQWVDVDGTVYDGYFDEDGNWVDYTYDTADDGGEYTESGEVVAVVGASEVATGAEAKPETAQPTAEPNTAEPIAEILEEQNADTADGHYNDFGQWVDVDGVVYDGYFDADGRWIDYSYLSESGETVSNGYFDDTISKWIPYGYFDENGNYVPL